MPILIGMVVMILACVFMGIKHVFPNFFDLRLKRIVDMAICLFGLLSPFALTMINAAAVDIYRDYLSRTPVLEIQNRSPQLVCLGCSFVPWGMGRSEDRLQSDHHLQHIAVLEMSY